MNQQQMNNREGNNAASHQQSLQQQERLSFQFQNSQGQSPHQFLPSYAYSWAHRFHSSPTVNGIPPIIQQPPRQFPSQDTISAPNSSYNGVLGIPPFIQQPSYYTSQQPSYYPSHDRIPTPELAIGYTLSFLNRLIKF